MKGKVVFVAVLALALAGLVLSVVNYGAASAAVNNTMRDGLMAQAEDWRVVIDAYEENIKSHEESALEQATQLATVQARMIYDLIDAPLRANGDTLPANIEEDLLTRMNRNRVGESGYAFVIDYEANYILSKDRARDGENIWDIADADGNKSAQTVVEIGMALTDSEIGYNTYVWRNPDDDAPRTKTAAFVHFPQLEWIAGSTVYHDDLLPDDYGDQAREQLIDLMAEQVIGESGYLCLVNTDGVYDLSKNRLRDGEDISQSVDADGRLFIQEAVARALAAGAGGVDSIEYPWQNLGEDKPRMKAGGLAYSESWDTVVWPTAYYDDNDSYGTTEIVTIVLSSLLVAGLLSYGVMSYRLFRR
jgi:signal transduction histidine kinase